LVLLSYHFSVQNRVVMMILKLKDKELRTYYVNENCIHIFINFWNCGWFVCIV